MMKGPTTPWKEPKTTSRGRTSAVANAAAAAGARAFKGSGRELRGPP